MDNRHHSSGGSGSNLFFLGIIIGVVITLLLTTKKGRKILEILIDEGVEKMSKWEDVISVIEKNSNKIIKEAKDATEKVGEKAVGAQVVTQEVKEEVAGKIEKVVQEVQEKKEERRFIGNDRKRKQPFHFFISNP